MFVGSLATVVALWCLVPMIVLAVILRFRRRSDRSVGLVHPSSGGGGGGERVLWVALRAMMVAYPDTRFVLFTKKYPSPTEGVSDVTHLARLVKEQFGIVLPRPVEICFLDDGLAAWIEAKRYPRLTLVLQSWCGALALFVDLCVRCRCTPIVIETVGIPFLYPLLSIFAGVASIAYVHYPVISTDMIERVQRREHKFNNSSGISNSFLLSAAKLMYYRAFAVTYWIAGRFPHVVMTNSTWTNNHIKSLWKRTSRIVYPPCNVGGLMSSKGSRQRQPWIVSVGQFRPEKDHPLQLKAFALAKKSSGLPDGARLYLVGGARNEEDLKRVESLRQQAAQLGITADVEFCVCLPFEKLRELLWNSAVGLHAMTDEHFGIVIVEYLAAGCIPLAHNSGGVKADIVRPEFGVLAETVEEYAKGMSSLLTMQTSRPDTMDEMRRLGQEHAALFSDEGFAKQLLTCIRASGLL